MFSPGFSPQIENVLMRCRYERESIKFDYSASLSALALNKRRFSLFANSIRKLQSTFWAATIHFIIADGDGVGKIRSDGLN